MLKGMIETYANYLPSKDAHVEWVDDEAVVLDQATGEIHYLNPSAALLYGLILEHGIEAAIQQVEKTHIDSDEQREELSVFMEQLVELGLLERVDD